MGLSERRDPGRVILMLSLLLALLFGLTSGASAQQRSLMGFRYIYVAPPTYEGGQVDSYGFAAYLREQLEKDKTWVVLNDMTAIEGDREALSQTVICSMGHDSRGATLTLFDVMGRQLQSFESSGVSWTSALSGYASSADDIRSNFKGCLKKLRSARPRFDPTKVTDLATLFKNVERFGMTEAELQKYLAENEQALHPIEGVWSEQEGQYRIGIVKRQGTAITQFVAFVLEAKNALWEPGMVKARLDPTAYEGAFVARFFMGDHSEVGSTAKMQGGVLSFPVRFRDRDDVVNFIKMSGSPSISVAKGDAPGKASLEVVGTGTGFMCREDLIVTNYHVIQGGTAWEVTFPTTGQSYKLDVVVSDKANDLAVLKLVAQEGGKKPALIPLKIAPSTEARIGEELYTIGFPLGKLLGSGHKVATGVLSATAGLEDDPRMFQITVPTQPGNSGGPILDSKGQVVGVLASTLSVEYLYRQQKHIPQNVNFAIKSDYLEFLLRQAPGVTQSVPASISGLSRTEQIARVQDSVGQITARK